MGNDNSGYETFDSTGGPTYKEKGPSKSGGNLEGSKSIKGAPGSAGEDPDSAVEIQKG